MGSVCDFHDLKRFMRCKEGKEIMEEIRGKLEGARIKRLDFSNETEFISIILHLERGKMVKLLPPNLEPGYIRDKYQRSLDKQEYLDALAESRKRPRRKKESP